MERSEKAQQLLRKNRAQEIVEEKMSCGTIFGRRETKGFRLLHAEHATLANGNIQ